MRSKKGSVLIFTCLVLIVLMGIAGIAVDVGRIFIGRNELQSFAEAAALTAATQLDGTGAGIAKATEAVENTATGPNAMKWDMATKNIDNITTTFGAALAANSEKPDPASWTDHPNPAANYRFVRVVASASVPSIFLQAFEHAKDAANNAVGVGVAVRASKTESGAGHERFSVVAPNADAVSGPPNWGFEEGKQYALVSSNSDGASALANRVSDDSDSISSEYATYATNGKGNGRRLIALPITDGRSQAIGAAQFFLLTPDVYAAAKANDPIWVEYVGAAADASQAFSGAQVRLVQ